MFKQYAISVYSLYVYTELQSIKRVLNYTCGMADSVGFCLFACVSGFVGKIPFFRLLYSAFHFLP